MAKPKFQRNGKVNDENMDSGNNSDNNKASDVFDKRKIDNGKPNNRPSVKPNFSNLGYNLVNLCGEVISQVVTNLVYNNLGVEPNLLDNSVTINLGITYNYDKLTQQANVFAKQFLSLGGVRYHYTFGTDRSRWLEFVSNLFIYSRFKAIVLGTRVNDLNTRYGNSYLFIGDSVLCDVLRTGRFQYQYDPGIFISFRLVLSETEKEVMINDYLKDFPWLRDCYVDQPGMGVNVVSTQYDMFLDSIRDAGNFPQSVQVVNIKESTHTIQSLLMSDSIPLGNSFYNSSLTGFYYIHMPLQNVKNHSYSWSRAMLITCEDVDVTKYYQFLKFVNPRIYAKYDASSVVGIPIRFDPDVEDDNGSFYSNPILSSKSRDLNDNDKGIPNTLVKIVDKLSDVKSQTGDANLDSDPIEDISSAIVKVKGLFKNLNVLFDVISELSDDVLPFDIHPDLNLNEVLDIKTLVELTQYAISHGVRFRLSNFNYGNNFIETKDSKIKFYLDKSIAGHTIDINDVYNTLSIAWLSKAQGLLSKDHLTNLITNKFQNTGISFTINKHYHITAYGGDIYVSDDGVNVKGNPITVNDLDSHI